MFSSAPKKVAGDPVIDLILPDLRRQALQGVTDGHAEIDVLHLSWKEKTKDKRKIMAYPYQPWEWYTYIYLHGWLIFMAKCREIYQSHGLSGGSSQ